MKKLLLLPLIAIIFLSCSKSNPPAPKPTTLIAKWNMVSDTALIILKDFYDPSVTGTPIPIPHPSYFQFNNDGTGSSVANQDPQAIVRHFDYDFKKDTIIELNYRTETINNVNYAAVKDSALIIHLNFNNLTLGFYGGIGEQVERAHFTK